MARSNMKKKKTIFKQRFHGFKKKAMELSVLCGNSVGFICYGPDDLHVWPDQQTLSHLVDKFNLQTDEKKKKNRCDINDFPDLKGLSVEQLKDHLSCINSLLDGIKQKKITIVTNNLTADYHRHHTTEIIPYSPRVSAKEIVMSRVLDLEPNHKEEDRLLTVSDDDQPQLGFGNDPFDELGYLLRGFTGLDNATVSDLGGVSNSDALVVSDQFWAADLYPMPSTYDQVWDCMDLGFNSTPAPLLTYDDDQLFFNVDSIMTNNNTCQTPFTDNFQTSQPFTFFSC